MGDKIAAVMAQIKASEAKFVDLRFTDTLGKDQHMTIMARDVGKDFFEEGKAFDGSSIAGWKSIDSSDMILAPDADTAFVDPFYRDVTLVLRCDVVEPSTMMGYKRDPRGIAQRADAYLQSTGIADKAFFGPEPEFFIFDDVRWRVEMDHVTFQVDSIEAAWNSDTPYPEGNRGHRPGVQGGYFPVPPVDSSQDIRSAMALTLEQIGIEVEVHHHEVATGNQNEIGTRFNTLITKADELQNLKYVVRNVAHAFGKTATFMPKPLVGDNGSGMHCHISLGKTDGTNLFAGDKYAGLSEIALFFMGGILKHSRALNAFTNPTTNSYKRLVPGFEAPVMLAYSACNRSASFRVPYVSSPKGRRVEVRYPDATANPYLAFSALLMAGVDGIQNKIHPGDPMDKNLYDLPPEEKTDLGTVCGSLNQAIESLEADHAFLLEGGVFSEDMLRAYCKLKHAEVERLALTTHPLEFEMYYSD